MTYAWNFANSPAARVLRAIQLRGQASIKDVAADLGVTASAVRLQVTQLENSGVIRAEKVREGVGRPYHLYSATPEAHNLFCKDYGDLAKLLLAEVADTQGPGALQDVLRRVSDRLAELYRTQVSGQELADRVRNWASLLDERGVLVKIAKTDAGYVLEEYGCPYQNLAIENRAVCDMERQVMAHVLESGVELTRCMLDGYPNCRFRVSEET